MLNQLSHRGFNYVQSINYEQINYIIDLSSCRCRYHFLNFLHKHPYGRFESEDYRAGSTFKNIVPKIEGKFFERDPFNIIPKTHDLADDGPLICLFLKQFPFKEPFFSCLCRGPD